jgi:hypothetical protein
MSMGATDLVAPEGQKHLATEENARCHQDHPSKFVVWIIVVPFVFGFVYFSPLYPSEYRLTTPDFLEAGGDEFPDFIFKIGRIYATMFGLPGKLFWEIAQCYGTRLSLYV